MKQHDNYVDNQFDPYGKISDLKDYNIYYRIEIGR